MDPSVQILPDQETRRPAWLPLGWRMGTRSRMLGLGETYKVYSAPVGSGMEHKWCDRQKAVMKIHAEIAARAAAAPAAAATAAIGNFGAILEPPKCLD